MNAGYRYDYGAEVKPYRNWSYDEWEGWARIRAFRLRLVKELRAKLLLEKER